MRFAKSMAVILCFAFIESQAQAQIKIEGPTQATVCSMVKLKMTQLSVDDPKFKCIPANDDWMACRDYDNNNWIIYVPSPKTPPGLVTFVVAGNKEGKTYLETHEITITNPTVPITPVTPVVPVVPVESEICKTLKASYMVAPNAKSKTALLGVYQQFLLDINADKFKSNKEAADVLKTVTPKYVGTDLQPLRDSVAEYLAAEVGTSGMGWNKDKLSKAMTTVIGCITAIKD